MNDTGLFHEEEKTVRAAEELLAGGPRPEISWPTQYGELLAKYRKLLSQANLLVNVSDLMQKDLTTRNEQLKSSQESEERLRTQLLYSQKMEAIGTLAGGIAHDFNNLLTIINGFAEIILLKTAEDDPRRRDLEKILESGRKGAEMVQRLLAFSKKSQINPQSLDLNLIVENSVRFIRRTFPKTIEIETILAKDLGMVSADASQMEQVIVNLCINAKEAMPDGGRLRIESRRAVVDDDYCGLNPDARPGVFAIIDVSDSGGGMDAETAARIFDPFFTTKGWGSAKGTGLGLSVVKGIVEQHDGWITLKSEPGKGTTFTVCFPVIKDSAAARKPEPVAETVPDGKKILLVDDEEYVRDLGKRILEGEGYAVITAANGQDALDIYASEPSNISLVVLDLIMPQMEGQRCLEELLKINPDVKVIVSTGHALGARENLLLEPLVRGFVNKPYDVRKMAQIVKEALGGSTT